MIPIDRLNVSVCHSSELVHGLLEQPYETGGSRVETTVAPSVTDAFVAVQRGLADAGEVSLAFHAILTAAGVSPFVGVPVFPARAFRHGNVLARADDTRIEHPGDLAGRTVAVAEYAATMAVWVRGMLQDEHGVDPTTVTWMACRPPVLLPPDLGVPPPTVEVVPAYGQAPIDLLLSGRADVAFDFKPLGFHLERGRPVKCVFGDPATAEAAYWHRTGVFPIMHLLAVRREVYERRAGSVPELFEAFSRSRAGARLEPEPAAWSYGLEPNTTTLRAFLDHAAAQGLLAREVGVAELFAPGAEDLTEERAVLGAPR